MAKVDLVDDKEKPGKRSEKVDDPDRPYRDEAVAVHRLCRNMAASMFKGQPVHKIIWQFGQSTRYLARTAWNERTWKGNLRSILPYFEQFSQELELNYMLTRLSRLPPEIENQIRPRIQSTTLSCLVNFIRTTVPLMKLMSDAQPPKELLFHESTPYLCATGTTVYESPMIQCLDLVKEAQDDVVGSFCLFSRTVSTRNMEGVQLLPGHAGTGISAVRVLYADGAVSHWMGSVFSEWNDECITILGREVSGLRIHQDASALPHSQLTLLTLLAEFEDYKS